MMIYYFQIVKEATNPTFAYFKTRVVRQLGALPSFIELAEILK